MLETTWTILSETAAFLLFGFAIAGGVHVVLSRWSFARYLGGRGSRGVFLATLVGLPLPFCSCSVLPTALTLREKGASPGATLAFLVSTPETSVPSVLLTYALLGPVMAVVRPVAACASAIAAGLAGNAVSRGRGAGERDPVPQAPACADDGCGCGADPPPTGGASDPPPGWGARVRAAGRFAFVSLFDDVFGWVLVGILVAAAIRVFVPPETMLTILGGPVQSMLIMVLVGVPLYVCAEASTPVAAVFIAQGVSPGAALVFLLVGPATNIGALGILDRRLGRPAIVAYLAAIVVVAVGSGVAFDAAGGARLVTSVLDGAHRSILPEPVTTAAAILFLALGVGTIVRRRWVPRLIRLGGPRTVRSSS